VVVERKVGLVPPLIEASIWTESTGMSNEIHALTGDRAVDTYLACLSAIITRHAGISHFEMIETRMFKFLHEKINLGGEHIHLFKLVNLASAGLTGFIS
jgi:hypothetical protein